MQMGSWRKRSELPGEASWPARFRNEVDRLFSRFLGDPGWGESAGGWAPDVDVEERDREISVRAEIPGLDPKDIHISVTGSLLTISGEKRETQEQRTGGQVLSEIRYGSFYRTVPLPETANPDDVEANYDQGVLSVRIGTKEGAAARRVEVRSKGGDGKPEAA